MAGRTESVDAPRQQGARLRMGGDTPGFFAEKKRRVPPVARSATKLERGGAPPRGGAGRARRSLGRPTARPPPRSLLPFPASPRVSLVSRRNPSGDRPPAAALECQGICETVHWVPTGSRSVP